MLYLKNYFTIPEQIELVELARSIAASSPLTIPVMPSGAKFNCQMTSCGIEGWISDRTGYRYSKIHPVTKQAFPSIPQKMVEIAKKLACLVGETDYQPETCLINYYPANSQSKLGIHQDNSEANLKPCIISISLGDDCIFTIGTRNRKDPTRELLLTSGDALILHGESRLAYHSVKKILPGTSSLLKNGGRLNFTIRQIY